MFRFCLLVAIAVACALPGVASADTHTLGLGGWQVRSSASSDWLPVHPDDAGAPDSEINALLQNGACPNVFFSTRMKDCFGYTDQWVAIGRFAVPWWYRTEFRAPRRGHADIVVNGIVGAGDVWVNGTKVGSVQGAFTRTAFDVTGLLHRGRNTLAIKVQPNDPNTFGVEGNDPNAMFTLDDVDWNQIPPDNHTAIQFPVQLHTSRALALDNAHVVEDNAPDMSRSSLTVKGDVTNNGARGRTALVRARITPGDIRLARRVSVPAGATRTVTFDPVTIRHPRVWWPYQLGRQPLYRLSMRVGHSDSASETFGIRTITTRLVGPAPSAPAGSRQFIVNGTPIVFRGGGFAEDLFLRYSSASTARQIAMIKNLGLNGIRLEGHEMPNDFYEQMDRAGILIDAGFQCCDRWELPEDGSGVTDADYRVIHDSALAIGRRLRNHPSVMNYSWSDNNPIPRQEQEVLSAFRETDFREPVIASAEYKSTPTLGPSGEKEGPYDWVPPSYWYDTSHFDPGDDSRTNVGGAWAFDSESGAGDTVPTLDSIRRFLSPAEQAALWQQPDFNQYHTNYEPDLPGPDNDGYSFGTLHSLDTAIAHRYGTWSSLGQYVEQAQAQNYETQRAQFEAYIDHSTNAKAPSTGIIYWQLNKGWPTLLWDLYNQDFDQAGSYFGAKKANKPLHVLYAYDDGTVSVDDLGARGASGLSVDANVYDVAGHRLDHQVARGLRVASQGVLRGVLKPAVPSGGARTYFVQLLLRRQHRVVDRNVYWLPTKPDVVDWDATIGHPQATMTRYADLKQLQNLAPARIAARATSRRAGDRTVTRVTISNTSSTRTVGFLLRADVRRGTRSGAPDPGDNEVLPIAWSDNEITLWPGESQTLTATYRTSDLHGRAPVVSVSGWNAKTMTTG